MVWIQYSNHLSEEMSLFIEFFPGVGGSLLNSIACYNHVSRHVNRFICSGFFRIGFGLIITAR